MSVDEIKNVKSIITAIIHLGTDIATDRIMDEVYKPEEVKKQLETFKKEWDKLFGPKPVIKR